MLSFFSIALTAVKKYKKTTAIIVIMLAAIVLYKNDGYRLDKMYDKGFADASGKYESEIDRLKKKSEEDFNKQVSERLVQKQKELDQANKLVSELRKSNDNDNKMQERIKIITKKDPCDKLSDESYGLLLDILQEGDNP